MNYYCRVCGKTQDGSKGLTHTHTANGSEYYIIQLIPTIEKEGHREGRSTFNRRIKTTQKAAKGLQEE